MSCPICRFLTLLVLLSLCLFVSSLTVPQQRPPRNWLILSRKISIFDLAESSSKLDIMHNSYPLLDSVFCLEHFYIYNNLSTGTWTWNNPSFKTPQPMDISVASNSHGSNRKSWFGKQSVSTNSNKLRRLFPN